MDKKCPFFKSKCIMDKCMFWTHLYGANPQTGQLVDEYSCAIVWLPLLLIENAKNVSQTQAAVESGRNKQVEFQDTFIGILKEASDRQKIEAKSEPKQIENGKTDIIDAETDES